MLKPEFALADFKDLAQRYSAALSTLEGWGVRIGDRSRLRMLVPDLEFLASGRIPKNAQAVAYLAHSVLEADEVADIVESLTESDVDAEVREKLKLLHKDPAIKRQAVNAPGRSSQFELFIRALLTRGGLGVEMSTPDLKLSTNDGKQILNLEAKRPQSSKNLEGNIKKALSQIDGEKPGAIVLGLDHLVFGNKDVIILESGDSFEDGSGHLIEVVSAWLSDQRRLVEKCIFESGVPIAGIVLIAKLPIVSHKAPVMGFACHLRAIRIAPVGSVEHQAFARLDEALDKAWRF